MSSLLRMEDDNVMPLNQITSVECALILITMVEFLLVFFTIMAC
jgi:hypothetical protein